MTAENHTAREARLAEIAERHAKATPGSWAVLDARGDIYGHWVIHPDGDAELGNWSMAERVRRREDAEFIANSRADIPYLLTELASADKWAVETAVLLLDAAAVASEHYVRPDGRGWICEACHLKSVAQGPIRHSPSCIITRLRTAADHGRE